MPERLDIILFGATGHTGKHCIKYLHKLTKSDGRLLTWGIAGRSQKKLEIVLKECSTLIGKDLGYVKTIIADINDKESLNKMTASAKIVINCCGPYQLFGEDVVLACLETSTHLVDVSGEPYYIENMYYKYNTLAKQKKVYIISACGYDSIPADLGTVFLQQNFEGTLNSVEIYLSAYNKRDMTDLKFNSATWNSFIAGKKSYNNLSDLRKKIFKNKLPQFSPKLLRRPSLHKSSCTNTWVKRYTGSDRSIAYRTQKYLYEQERIRPVQIGVYEVINSFVEQQFAKLYGNIANFLTDYEFGTKLVLENPAFFSCGRFQTKPVSDDHSNNIVFRFILDGRGWSKGTDIEKQKPNKRLICEMSGTNPGYGFTCVCVSLSAIVVITETDKLPEEGGVYTPGAAFANTTLMSQLMENGLSLKIDSKL